MVFLCDANAQTANSSERGCIYTDYHCRILQQTAYKEINIDKMLRDIPLFTVFRSRGLAREFQDVSREQNLDDSFWS